MIKMTGAPLVRLVDDDDTYRQSQTLFLGIFGFNVQGWSNAAAFLAEEKFVRPGCIVLDIRMPGMNGIELHQKLSQIGCGVSHPILFLTGHGDIETAVHSLKAGAFDFIEKHGDPMRLKEAVEKACTQSLRVASQINETLRREEIFNSLTARERDVLLPAALGVPNKIIATKLGIGTETVKMHRANAFGKLGVQSALEAYRWLEVFDSNKIATSKNPGSN